VSWVAVARWLRRRVGLLLVAVLNLVVLFTFTLPRAVSERELDARLRALATDIAARTAANLELRRREQWVSDNRREAEQILAHDMGSRENGLVPLLGELEASAREFGLTLGGRTLVPEELDDVPVTRVKIELPVEGTYGALVGFVRRLEHSRRFLTIDDLRLQEKHQASGPRVTALAMTLSAYFRSSLAGATSAELGGPRAR